MSPLTWAEQLMAGTRPFPPAGELVGLRMVGFDEGSTTIEMPVTSDVLNRAGGVQGGILAVLADANMGTALSTVTDEGETHATIEFKLNFFRPAPAGLGSVIAVARVLHRSRRIAHVESEIRTPAGDLIAKATSTWVIRRTDRELPERE